MSSPVLPAFATASPAGMKYGNHALGTAADDILQERAEQDGLFLEEHRNAETLGSVRLARHGQFPAVEMISTVPWWPSMRTTSPVRIALDAP